MADEIIRELWEIKDGIAREHGYDVESLAARLRAREATEGRRILDRDAARRTSDENGPGESGHDEP